MDIIQDIKYNFSKRDNGLIKIILINVFVFVALSLSWFIAQLGFPFLMDFMHRVLYLPTSLDRLMFRPWTIITSFFSHQNFFHIFWNMIVLYWFGRLLSEYLGNRRFINVYILGGIIANFAVIAAYYTIPALRDVRFQAVGLGASGAVYAITIAAATLLPDYRFHLIFIGPVKIKYIAWTVIFLSLISTAGQNTGGNIAHLMGALVGFVYIKQLKAGRDIGKPISMVAEGLKIITRPRMRVSYGEKAGNEPANHTPSQEEIDKILDKISRSGYESLTKVEKEKLFKASEK